MVALITAITALITAIVGLFVLLKEAGVIRPSEPKPPKRKRRQPERTYDHQWDDDD
jgi:hypothetical protein